MAIRDVVLLGFGANGSIPQVVTLGFFSAPAVGGDGFLCGCITVQPAFTARIGNQPALIGVLSNDPALTTRVGTNQCP